MGIHYYHQYIYSYLYSTCNYYSMVCKPEPDDRWSDLGIGLFHGRYMDTRASSMLKIWVISSETTQIFRIDKTPGLLLNIWILLWRFTDREIIEVCNLYIDVHHSNIFFSRTKRYLAKNISGLRVSNPFWSFLPNWIAIDYGAKTIQFSLRLDEAEARQIIKSIQEKFPQFV